MYSVVRDSLTGPSESRTLRMYCSATQDVPIVGVPAVSVTAVLHVSLVLQCTRDLTNCFVHSVAT